MQTSQNGEKVSEGNVKKKARSRPPPPHILWSDTEHFLRLPFSLCERIRQTIGMCAIFHSNRENVKRKNRFRGDNAQMDAYTL